MQARLPPGVVPKGPCKLCTQTVYSSDQRAQTAAGDYVHAPCLIYQKTHFGGKKGYDENGFLNGKAIDLRELSSAPPALPGARHGSHDPQQGQEQDRLVYSAGAVNALSQPEDASRRVPCPPPMPVPHHASPAAAFKQGGSGGMQPTADEEKADERGRLFAFLKASQGQGGLSTPNDYHKFICNMQNQSAPHVSSFAQHNAHQQPQPQPHSQPQPKVLHPQKKPLLQENINYLPERLNKAPDADLQHPNRAQHLKTPSPSNFLPEQLQRSVGQDSGNPNRPKPFEQQQGCFHQQGYQGHGFQHRQRQEHGQVAKSQGMQHAQDSQHQRPLQPASPPPIPPKGILKTARKTMAADIQPAWQCPRCQEDHPGAWEVCPYDKHVCRPQSLAEMKKVPCVQAPENLGAKSMEYPMMIPLLPGVNGSMTASAQDPIPVLKGICSVCHQMVHSYHTRIKNAEGTYVHRDCLTSAGPPSTEIPTSPGANINTQDVL